MKKKQPKVKKRSKPSVKPRKAGCFRLRVPKGVRVTGWDLHVSHPYTVEE